MNHIYDATPCQLGEGPLWHPERGQLFWFDILGKTLHARVGAETLSWRFDSHVSAAGWVSRDELLIASERELFAFDLASGRSESVCALEADRPETRSNDGRADPWGGFWIGTMGKNAEPGAGAIYRLHQGELTQLHAGITISNAICFSPDRRHVYFTDTPTRVVRRQELDPETGWPAADPVDWLDLNPDSLNPDGAVVDAEGNFWNAQWGAGRVACYTPDGAFLKAVAFPGAHTSCPAFGGKDLSTLFCTTARQGLSRAEIDAAPSNGMTFAAEDIARGQREHRVIL